MMTLNSLSYIFRLSISISVVSFLNLALAPFEAVAQQQLEINIKVVQQRFCVPQGIKKAKASIQINVPAGNCDVEKMEINWNDNKSNEIFNVSIPSSKKDTSFIREHEFDLEECLYDRIFNILLTSTFKASCGKEPNLAPGIILFTNTPKVTGLPRPGPACVKQDVNLNLTFCPAKNVTYTIDYGDGTTGTSLTHAYDKVGAYTVSVKASNVCNTGNPTVTPLSVNIIDLATPKIGPDSGRVVSVRLDTATICFDGGGIIRLDGIGSINATAYDWDISPAVEYLDRTNENSPNPKIRFVKPGTYTVSLRVNNACNVWSSRVSCMHVVIDVPALKLDTPVPPCNDFLYKPSPFDKNALYTINGKRLPSSGDTLLRVTGTPFTVIVEGKLDNVCGGVPKSITFTVGQAQTARLLSPRGDTTICAGTNDLLLATDLKDGNWEKNSAIIESNGKSYFKPATAGLYTLIYSRGVGDCLRTTTLKIQVTGVPIKTENSTTCKDANYLKLIGTPAGGQWSTQVNCPGCIRNDTLLLQNIPSGLSSLLLLYKITTSDGCSASATATVTIGQPKADFSITNGCSSTGIKVTNSSTGTSAFQWLVNGTLVSTLREPLLQLPAGLVNVTLISIAGSCTSTVSHEVTITPPPADVTFTPSKTSGCSPLTVVFNVVGLAQPGVNYSWNFGNQKSSTVFQPDAQVFSNTGRQPQSFTITFSGTNSCGSTPKVTQIITVLPQAKAEIGIDSTMVRCPPATLTFSNRSTGFQGNVVWDFGDQTTPISTSSATVTHEYKSPTDKQVYIIRLTANSECGPNRDSTQITVFPKNISPLFSISKDKICPGDKVRFTDTSTPKPARVVWEIDGNQLEGSTIEYEKFIKPGTVYTIKQTVYPECGGYATREQTIRTDTIPTGNFKLPLIACPDQPVSFTNASNAQLRFRWNFGDGSTIDSTYFSPTHTYTKGGSTYAVIMTVVGFPIACTNTVTHTIQIRNGSKPEFSVLNQGVFCSDTLVTLLDQSQNATEWKWYANDKLISINQNPQVHLNKGVYDIKLWVSNSGICADSVLRQDVVRVDTCSLNVADVFTPDENSIGDFFNVYGNNITKVKELRIFNRWGIEVYNRTDLPPNTQLEGWDGRYNGKPLPADNYTYEVTVEFVSGSVKQQHGVLTLLR